MRLEYLRDGVGRVDSVHGFIFDLEADRGERQDLSQAQAAMLPPFRKLVADWEADVMEKGAGDRVRIAGHGMNI